METISNKEKARELVTKYERNVFSSKDYTLEKCIEEAMQWKDEQILLDDDDKLATEVKVDGVTITPPQGYLIGKVTYIKDSLIVEFKKH